MFGKNGKIYCGLNYYMVKKSDFIMSGGTYGESPDGEAHGDSDERDGIFYGHAYSILAAYEVKLNNG